MELFIEANEHGRRRVIAPTTGSADFAKSDVVSWGLFGVAWGLIVGFAGGDSGVLGPIENGLVDRHPLGPVRPGRRRAVRHVGWARGVRPTVEGARSLRAARHLARGRLGRGSPSQETIERWAAHGSQRLILRFNPVDNGAVLAV